MKFSSLFQTSTILLWQQSVFASAVEEEHRNVRASLTSTVEDYGTESVVTKSVAATAIICEDLTLDDLNLKEFGNNDTCNSKDIFDHVRNLMAEKGCRNKRSDVKDTIVSLTETSPWKQGLKVLKDKCKEEGAYACAPDFTVNGCDFLSVKKVLQKKKNKKCPHDADAELQLLTGTGSLEEAKEKLAEICSAILDSIEQSTFATIDDQFTDDFMMDYIDGEGFLNEGTGNFQGDTGDSDEESVKAGKRIGAFREEGATNTILNDGDWGTGSFDSCESQAYLCCFGRDRQFGDNNGNCNEDDCEDADPGDNSNLCFTEPNLTAYPGEIEDDIHCHGLAWSDDTNDLTSRFKVNNFFFVSMFDHMYTRGYVEATVTDGPNEVPMCGCIEDMPKVSRADCSQVDVELEVSFSFDATGGLKVEASEEPAVEFNACKGINPGTGNKKNNDLASYAKKLHEEGRIDDEAEEKIFEILLGYETPRDNENEAVCKAAYEELATDEDGDHPCLDIDSKKLEFNGCDYATISKVVKNRMGSCEHDLNAELKILTGEDSEEAVIDYINQMCSTAWEELWDLVDTSKFEEISSDFNDGFMKEYIKGETYLNLETGNFQGAKLNKSDKKSVEAGEGIAKFHDAEKGGASTSMLEATFESEQTNFQKCELNSIMCCFGRDRQFGDNNGDCDKDDCEDADPGDNSNLCYTKDPNTAYPQDAEGDIHCHGLAWADDANHPSAALKYNNFFYVSLYDHMYTRGYVQTMTFDKEDATEVPMCGCIEDMMPVSRSDCTEIEVIQDFKLEIGVNGNISVFPVNLDGFEIEFNACAGLNPGNPTRKKNNDLASYVYRLAEENLIQEETKNDIYKILVGYEKPGSNSNEAACKASYEEEIGGKYPKK